MCEGCQLNEKCARVKVSRSQPGNDSMDSHAMRCVKKSKNNRCSDTAPYLTGNLVGVTVWTPTLGMSRMKTKYSDDKKRIYKNVRTPWLGFTNKQHT